MADYKILTIPFARDAVPDMVNDIPNDPSIAEPQLASFKQGFPSITTIPLVAGGIPPEGQDFNGILRDITEHVVHQNKGGMYKFEADVVAAGGYAKGAVLASNDGLSLWVSLQNNNVQDFNTGTSTQWARIAFSGLDALLNGKLDATANAVSASKLQTARTINGVAFDGTANITLPNTDATPAGAVMAFARSTAPAGWLKANGSAISRTTYSALFAAIGTTFGAGDGSTTFNLPDLRGEFLRGWDDARGVDSGRTFASWQDSDNKSHTHTASTGSYGHTHTWSGTTSSDGAHTHTVSVGGQGGVVATPGDTSLMGSSSGTQQQRSHVSTSTTHTHTVSGTTSSDSHTHTVTVNATGGTEARPRNRALLFCIKY